jgi:hypothetical protein
MLVDGGAAVNLMPYSLYRKLGKQDDELVKTNMTLSGVGDSSIKARGVTSVELTIGTNTLAAAFFVADVEGNYSLILGQLFCKLALFGFFCTNMPLAVSFQKMDPMLDVIIIGA